MDRTDNTLENTNKGQEDRENESDDFVDNHIRENIIKFLRGLADSFEQKSLTSEVEKQVSEFFLKFNFDSTLQHSGKETQDTTEQDLFKFLSLGWYIYTELIDSPPTPPNKN